MRVLLVLPSADVNARLQQALVLRGHQVALLAHEPRIDPGTPALSASDLVIADVEVASREDLVGTIASRSPGTEIVLLGSGPRAEHPDVIEHLEHPLELDRLLAVIDELANVVDGEHVQEPISLVAYETLFAGDSPQIRDLLRRVRLVSRSEAPVWVFGDDGSGRSVVARAIHDRSPRRAQPFLAFNCTAYSDDELCRRLFEGESAAIDTARTGTLFIEGISASGPSTQRELVRYLERTQTDGPGTRFIIGVQSDKATDGAAQFAAPELFYRLKVLEVEIPPLRDRLGDLEPIVARMLRRLAQAGTLPTVAPDTMRVLEQYSFPGNLLELAHALTHAFVLARGDTIQPQHLPISIRRAAPDGENASVLDGDLEVLDVVAKRFERDYLLRVLRSVAGNRGRAAEILGLSRKGLWGKLKAHGISDDEIDGDGTP